MEDYGLGTAVLEFMESRSVDSEAAIQTSPAPVPPLRQSADRAKRRRERRERRREARERARATGS